MFLPPLIRSQSGSLEPSAPAVCVFFHPLISLQRENPTGFHYLHTGVDTHSLSDLHDSFLASHLVLVHTPAVTWGTFNFSWHTTSVNFRLFSSKN